MVLHNPALKVRPEGQPLRKLTLGPGSPGPWENVFSVTINGKKKPNRSSTLSLGISSARCPSSLLPHLLSVKLQDIIRLGFPPVSNNKPLLAFRAQPSTSTFLPTVCYSHLGVFQSCTSKFNLPPTDPLQSHLYTFRYLVRQHPTSRYHNLY